MSLSREYREYTCLSRLWSSCLRRWLAVHTCQVAGPDDEVKPLTVLPLLTMATLLGTPAANARSAGGASQARVPCLYASYQGMACYAPRSATVAEALAPFRPARPVAVVQSLTGLPFRQIQVFRYGSTFSIDYIFTAVRRKPRGIGIVPQGPYARPVPSFPAFVVVSERNQKAVWSRPHVQRQNGVWVFAASLPGGTTSIWVRSNLARSVVVPVGRAVASSAAH